MSATSEIHNATLLKM